MLISDYEKSKEGLWSDVMPPIMVAKTRFNPSASLFCILFKVASLKYKKTPAVNDIGNEILLGRLACFYIETDDCFKHSQMHL